MAVFLLIRHGSNDTVGKLIPGRMPGVHLNEEGKAQAERLAERLSKLKLDAIYCSPLERTYETAVPFARHFDLPLRTSERLLEIDVGDWTGCMLQQLLGDPVWQHYNTFRAGTRAPNGELMIEVQERMVTEVERLRKEYPNGAVAIVSHGDPIKTVLAHYAGIPLDFILRIEISLASVSVISISDYGPKILCINHTGEIPGFLLSI